MKKKLYYAVDEWRQGAAYRALEIKIAKFDPNQGNRYPFWDAIRLAWQATTSDSPIRWYAGALALDVTGNLDKIAEAVRFARRICSSGYIDSVGDVIDTLGRMGEYVVRDPRLGDFVTSLLGPDYTAYRDDYSMSGAKHGHCVVLAKDPDSAVYSITREFRKSIASSHDPDGVEADYIKWLSAGKPVTASNGWSMSDPDYRTIDERVRGVDMSSCRYLADLQS
jgi:hypothetical protein